VPGAKKTDPAVISARNSKPGDARSVLLNGPRTIHELRFASLPVEVFSDQDFRVQVQAVDKSGRPVTDDSQSLGIGLLVGPTGHAGFTGGQLNAQLRSSIVEFTNLKLQTPGVYRLRVSTSGQSVDSGPIRVVSAKPKKVKLIVNGVAEVAQFEPPGTYVLSDNDRFEKVVRGRSRLSYEGIDYEIERLANDDVIVKTLGKTKDAKK
jgi:hypothetical protein